MIRAAPGLYPVREIVPPNTAAAFLILAGPYGFAEDELVDGEAAFVDRVDRVLRPNGYRLAGTFEPESGIAAGVVGFRPILSNAMGDHLWVDDFVTGGIGAQVERSQLLSFLKAEAKQLGLSQIHVDVFPDEPLEEPGEAETTGLSPIRSLDDLPRPSDPYLDRAHASLMGFREVAGRFVLSFADDEPSMPQDQEQPLTRRRQLGRPRRPRR
jgi:hypothetical protein